MKDYETLNKIWKAETPRDEYQACFCVGPQNGNPLCPCGMRSRTHIDAYEVLKTHKGKAE